MRIVMVAPAIMDWIAGNLVPIAMDARRQCPPYGLYLLAGIMRSRGHAVAMVDLIAQRHPSLDAFRPEIETADLVCISATSMSWPAARRAAVEIRSLGVEVPIVAGGIHPTMFDLHVLKTSPVDFVVRGEGELALPALVEALDDGRPLQQVPNLSWLDAEGQLARNPAAPKIAAADFGAMPLPAFDLLPDRAYAGLSLESSRGCAFDCSFCSTSYRRTYRAIEPANFVDRVERVLAGSAHLTSAGSLYIVDDEFSLNWKRAAAIARLISERGMSLQLIFDSRANEILQDDYLDAIAPQAYRFLIGAECGYDEGLERIGKGTTCALLTEAARRLADRGLAERADFSFILGLPWEDRAMVEQTIRFALRLHGRYGVRALLQWYCQIPGSRLWEEAREAGAVTEAMYDDFGFFRDLYLFRSAVGLTIDEIYAVTELIAPVQRLARAMHNTPGVIEYAFPEPVAHFYPPHTRVARRGGLANLREVAGGAINRVPISPGLPIRHLN